MHTPPLAYAFESLGPAFSVLSLVVLIVFSLALLYLLFELAGLPGRVAVARKHPRADAVRICGWLGLLTGIGWVIAMVWAYSQPRPLGAGLDAERIVSDLEQAVARLEQREGRART
ncbi:Inner membrane protein YiaW [Planctomycetes bacterium MalM25]|nr:Inner membrane protein YiaW [Planctomycetes bacterium MalM25]